MHKSDVGGSITVGLLAVGGVLSTTVELLTVADVTVSAAWTMPVVRINMSTRISVANEMIKFLNAIVGTFWFRGCG